MDSNTRPPQIPLAIIGMACRLPGADNLEQFWRLLIEGRSAIGEMPPDRLDQQLYYDPQVGVRGKTYSKLGALISSRQFDAAACPIDPQLANSVDNAHRLMCQVAAAALRHARLDPFNVPLRNTGVYIGHAQGSSLGGDYTYATCVEEAAHFLHEVPALQALAAHERDAIVAELISEVRRRLPHRTSDTPDVSASLVAGAISKAFGLSGPYLAINSACASSLQSILLGARALQLGHIDMAIVGGASDCKSDSLVLFSAARAMSATGSRPFDADADGLICGEGYAAIVLKTLERALADGDPIHAVLRGLGVSSDGKGKSLWAPRKEGQMLAMRRAYSHGLDMADLEYLEAHSTATQLGDATELNTLTEILRPILPEGKRIPITSVKANIGHTLETAGIAGVIKSVLCMHHETIPPAINIQKLNSKIDWQNAPVHVPRTAVPWPRRADGRPRRAGVNAFGIGGLNMHVVLDEYLPQARYEISGVPPSNGRPAQTEQLAEGSHAAQDDRAIAVIGLGCVLPGARDIPAFWELLSSGTDPKQPTPAGRWRTDLAYKPGSRQAYCTPTTLGGYITDFQYDWRRHKVPPKQIEQADPLQFMLLDAADQAMRDAGYDHKTFDRARAGVVVGTEFGGDFAFQLQMGLRLPEMQHFLSQLLKRRGWEQAPVETACQQFASVLLKHWPALIDETGSFSTSSLASRIAKTWDLMGGAAAIDAGETAGHAALATSIDMLQSGDCDLMICAAGQRRMSLPEYETLAINGLLATAPPYNPLDAAAHGYVPGEGVAVVLLKRLADARRDGDHVHAILRGTGAGHSADWGQAVQLAIARSLAHTSYSLSDISVLEFDALGAREETQRELASLVEQLRRAGRRRPLLLSNVFGQLGNTQGASGLVSLLKATLELRYGQVPAAIDLTRPHDLLSSAADLVDAAPQGAPLRLTTREGRRLAAVGSCARGLSYHIVIEHGERVPIDDALAAAASPTAQPANSAPTTSESSVPTTDLEHFLVNFVVEQTGYPPEVVELDADLEADLGIDSIKKAQLFGELQEYFDITPTDDLTLDDFPTLRHVLNFLAQAGSGLPQAATDAASEAPTMAQPVALESGRALQSQSISPSADPASASSAVLTQPTQVMAAAMEVDTTDLESFLINFVVEQTGYPPEVVELDADLEADLGIDSIKKAQLFGELQEYFDITPTDDLTLDDFPTLRHVLNFLARSGSCTAASESHASEPPTMLPPVAAVAVRTNESPALSSFTNSPSAVAVVPTQSPHASDGGVKVDTADLETFLINFVVEQTGYPPEVVELDADLEADLGIDSIKKAQLFGELQEYFDITPSDDLTLDDFPTLRHVLNFLAQFGSSAPAAESAVVNETLATDRAAAAVADRARDSLLASSTAARSSGSSADQAQPAPASLPATVDTADLETFLINFVVEQTGYPPEVVELDADLEADLGIDSIKKAQLFGELQEYFDITPSDDLTLDDFPTLRHVLNFLAQFGSSAPAEANTAAPSLGTAEENKANSPAPRASGGAAGAADSAQQYVLCRLSASSLEQLQFKLASLDCAAWFAEADRHGYQAHDHWRLCIVADGPEVLAKRRALAASQLGQPPARTALENQGIFLRQVPERRPRVAFLFPGQGSQYPGMLEPLVQHNAAARQAFDAINATLAGLGYPSFANVAWRDPAQLGQDVWTTQMAMLLADAIVLAALTDIGVTPDVVAGHSYGEYAALLAAGAWSLDEALRVTRARCDGIEACRAARGGMLAVSAPPEVIEREAVQLAAPVYTANLNAPDQTVVGGPLDALTALAQRLEARSHASRMLAVPAPFHTPLMRESTGPMQFAIERAVLQTPAITMYSIVTNQPVRSADDIRRNLVAHLTRPVRYQALIEQLADEAPTVFIEAGPNQALTRLHRCILGESNADAIACDNPKRSPLEQLACVQALLECLGVTDRPPEQVSQKQSRTEVHQQESHAAAGEQRIAAAPRHGELLRFDATERRREKMRAAAQGRPSKASPAPARRTDSQHTPPAANPQPTSAETAPQRTASAAATKSAPAGPKIIRPGTASVASSASGAATARPVHSGASETPRHTPPRAPLVTTPSATHTQVSADSAAATTVSVREVAPIRVATDLPRLELVQVHGSPYEIGRQHGAERREEIRAALERLADITDACWDELLPSPELLERPESVLDSDQLAELDGMADAIGIPRANLLAYNAVLLADLATSCQHFAQHSTQQPATGRLHGSAESIGMPSKLGERLLPLVQLRQPTSGLAHITIGFAGSVSMLGGLNSAGLAVTFSQLLDQVAAPLESLHFAQHLRRVLALCRDTSSAIQYLHNLPDPTGAWSLCLSDGAERPVYLVERIGAHMHVRENAARVFATNHTQQQAPARRASPDSQQRLDQLGRQLDTLSSCDGAALDQALEQLLAVTRSPRLAFVIAPDEGELRMAYASEEHPHGVVQHLRIAALLEMVPPNQVTEPPRQSAQAPAHDVVPRPEDTTAELRFTDEQQSVSQRFCLRTVLAPFDAAEKTRVASRGPALVVGQNAVARAVVQRLAASGISVQCLEDMRDPRQALDQLTAYWQHTPFTSLLLLHAWDQPSADLNDQRQWEASYQQLARIPLALCQRWLQPVVEAKVLDQCTVMALTDLGGDLGFGGTAIAPASGALTGLMKALCLEYYAMRGAKTFRAKAIDASRTEPAEMLADNILREWETGSVDYEVAFRGGQRYLQVAVPEDAVPRSAPPIRRGATWVVTGGARGISAACALELGRRYGLNLHLIGTSRQPDLDSSWLQPSAEQLEARRSEYVLAARQRGEKPHRVLARLEKELEISRNLQAFADAGIPVTYHTCDVADTEALARVLDHIRRTDGAIEGILHGAGVEHSCRFEKKSEEAVQATFGAKVEGAYHLMQLTRRDPLRHFLGFGSISGRLGSNGQADYCAASDMLCKLITWFRGQRPECHAVGFHWHPWDEAGMAARSETRAVMQMTGGPQLMPKATGIKHLLRELHAGGGPSEVLVTDWEYHQRYYPREVREQFVRQPTSAGEPAKADADPGDTARRHVMQLRDAQNVGPKRPDRIAALEAVLIYGDNPDARALGQQLSSAGVAVRMLPSNASADQLLSDFEALWQVYPARHLLLMSGRDPEAASGKDLAALERRTVGGVQLPYLLTQRWFQHVAKTSARGPATILAATALGGQFGFHSSVDAPEGGALTGLLKSIYVEDARFDHQNFRVKVVDSPRDEPPQQLAESILRELSHDQPEVEVSWSRGVRRVVTCVDQPLARTNRSTVPRGGTWIVTGGARGITAATALELGRRYCLKLHLLGRSPAPDAHAPWQRCTGEELKAIKRSIVREAVAAGRTPEDDWDRVRKDREIFASLETFEAAGVRATYHCCDVADSTSLARVLDLVRSCDGPIEGVLHGAGYAKAGRFETRERERFLRTLAPKVEGTLALMALTQVDPLKYFITFGSLSGRFGGNGLSDYAAANDMLAKLGAWFRQHRPECRTTCFHWQTWDRIGMAMLADGVGITKNAFKMDFLAPEEGVRHVCDELEAGLPESEVLITDGYFERVFYPRASQPSEAPSAARLPLIEPLDAGDQQPRQTPRVVWRPDDDPFLAEHRLKNKPFLPGVLGIEALVEAAAAELGPGVKEIRDVEIVNGLQFYSTAAVTCEVHIEQAGDVLQCRLTSEQRDRRGRLIDPQRVHVRGKVPRAADSDLISAKTPGRPPLGWMPYTYPDDAILYHGPPLRALRAVAYQYDGGWGQIVAPPLAELGGPRGSEGWILPTSVLDACVVCCGSFVYLQFGGVLEVPHGFARLRWSRMPEAGETCVVRIYFRSREAQHSIFDFTLFGSDDTPLIDAVGYRTIRVGGGRAE